jgi:RNase P protein component
MSAREQRAAHCSRDKAECGAEVAKAPTWQVALGRAHMRMSGRRVIREALPNSRARLVPPPAQAWQPDTVMDVEACGSRATWVYG